MGIVYPRPDPECRTCGRPVAYRLRFKCRSCGAWCHGRCCDRLGMCRPCGSDEVPSPEEMRKAWLEIEPTGELMTSGLITVAMLSLGPDEERIASHLGLDIAEVRERCDRLREQGVWRDGKIVLGFDERSPPMEITVGACLIAMIAEGIVYRTEAKDGGVEGA